MRERGGTSNRIPLEDIPRPASYEEGRLQQDLAKLMSRLDKVFERLGNLKQEGIEEGTVNAGHFNIAKGNVAEVLSESLQEDVLPQVQQRFPKAQIITGVRVRLMGPDGLSDAKLFTDNLIGTFEGTNLEVHGKFEVKSGPRGGAEATTQVFEWVEGRLTDESQLLIPGHDPFVWHPVKPGTSTVTGLANANTYLVTPRGAEHLGADSAMQTVRDANRLALKSTSSEIDYLTRRIIETLKKP